MRCSTNWTARNSRVELLTDGENIQVHSSTGLCSGPPPTLVARTDSSRHIDLLDTGLGGTSFFKTYTTGATQHFLFLGRRQSLPKLGRANTGAALFISMIPMGRLFDQTCMTFGRHPGPRLSEPSLARVFALGRSMKCTLGGQLCFVLLEYATYNLYFGRLHCYLITRATILVDCLVCPTII